MQGKRWRSLITVTMLGALAALPGACGDAAAVDSGRLVVATTVAPLTSIVSAVAGDRASVTGIVPEGTNSHTFEPSPKTAELLSRADLIVLNGLSLEDPTKEMAERNKRKNAEIIELGTQVLPPDQWIFDFSFPKKDGKPNPHLWTDPPYAVEYAQAVAATLSRRDPRNADYYHSNYEHFAGAANALADALRADQATIPDGRRVLLTYHDAYAYFGRTFGWAIVGAVQPRNFEDPSPNDVAALIDQVKAQHVPTIFGSEVFPSKVLEEIGRATGAHYEDTLRDDDLPGRPGQADHSWFGLMRYDFTTMVRGLHGTTTHLDALSVTQSAIPDGAVYPQ